MPHFFLQDGEGKVPKEKGLAGVKCPGKGIAHSHALLPVATMGKPLPLLLAKGHSCLVDAGWRAQEEDDRQTSTETNAGLKARELECWFPDKKMEQCCVPSVRRVRAVLYM